MNICTFLSMTKIKCCQNWKRERDRERGKRKERKKGRGSGKEQLGMPFHTARRTGEWNISEEVPFKQWHHNEITKGYQYIHEKKK